MTKDGAIDDERRRLPSMDRVLARPELRRLAGYYGREPVRAQARREIDELRRALESGESAEALGLDDLVRRVEAGLAAGFGRPLRRVLNATGVFLHTNLGRAPLPVAIAERLPTLLTASCDLELDLESGRRTSRTRRVEALLRALTGAEAAVVVNNNAAALMLALATLARDREVVVSRGELVEIGGSFRIPDLVEAAGARLVEVGTTNRTRLSDYERAVGPRTGVLLRVHPSNYRIEGFTEAPQLADLALLARDREVPLVVDEGSGLLRSDPRPQLTDHPSLAEIVAAGADVACGSGDKLVGGPQAGLLVGSCSRLDPCRSRALYRALRLDRFALAALEGVLELHLTGAALPLDRMWPSRQEIDERLEAAGRALDAEIVDADAHLGGGTGAQTPIPGRALALPDDGTLAAALRAADPPVVGYVRGGRLILDLRTVDPTDDGALVAAVRAVRSAT